MYAIGTMFNYFRTKFQQYLDVLLVRQSFFCEKYIREYVEDYRQVYYVGTSHYLKKIIIQGSSTTEPSFLLCVNSCKREVMEILFGKYGIDHEEWEVVFYHTYFSFFENKRKRGKSSSVSFTVSNEIMQNLFYTARSEIKKIAHVKKNFEKKYVSLESSKNISVPQGLFHVDVTLWHKGRLHGSYIVYRCNLEEGVLRAARLAFLDERFSRLSYKDTDDIRIEICIVSPLGFPLVVSDVINESIMYDKSYCILSEEQTKSGWYVPPTFNCIRVHTLTDYITRLETEKLGRPYKKSSTGDIFIHQTISFIESYDKKEILRCDGPVALKPTRNLSLEQELFFSIKSMLAYLERIQRDDGYFFAIIDPLSGECKEDFDRFCFTVYALALHYSVTKDVLSYKIVTKGIQYAQQHAFEKAHVVSFLAYVYIGLSYFYLNDTKGVEKVHLLIVSFKDEINYDPVTYSQLARFLLITGYDLESSYSFIKKLIDAVCEDYQFKLQNGLSIDLAAYVELPWLLQFVNQVSDNEIIIRTGNTILDNYISLQKSIGSFPTSLTDDFSYVRGTAKILEVLVQMDNIDKSILEKGLGWCITMQYSKESTYFLTSSAAKLVEGGLRHDYGNHEVWIDSMAHMLIASTLYIKTKITRG